MKRTYILLIALFSLTLGGMAQTNIKVGGGYYGHWGTHPGVVLEFESEKMFSENISLPLRVDLGLYSHPRNHTGTFIDVNYGFRRYFDSGLFLEQSIGFGLLSTHLNSDGVFEVDDAGNVSETSRNMPVDLMPSVTLGMGYKLNNDKTLLWMRPKLAWQFPHKTNSLYHVNIQLGFTHTFGEK